MTFSNMATKLLSELGFNIDVCQSEKEAINKSTKIDNNYPVFYSGSDTTGEKPYEEFFTEEEEVDLERHKSLGVVVNLEPRSTEEVDQLFDQLNAEFQKEITTKENIVEIMKDFLINFDHIEVGKTLDSKM